ncbi:MAG: phosphatase PAP2 family protein, partial [Blastocatellia bacterium]
MRFQNATIKLISLSLTLNMLLAISVEPLELLNSRVSAEPLDGLNGRQREPHAGTWRTYALTSGAEVPISPPPHRFNHQTRTELAELRSLQAQRTPAVQTVIDFWNAQPAFKPWTETHLDLIRARGVNTMRAHRGLALVHAAIYDAVIATWYWKYTYHRPRPDRLDRSLSPSVEPPRQPSYPSEHAAIAGAAARMLGHLFPEDAETLKARAAEAALSRLQAGANYRSDIEAGIELG